MKPNDNHNPKVKSDSAFFEIVLAVIGLFFNDISNKIGLGLLLIVLGLVFVFANTTDHKNSPIVLVIIGIIFMLIGLLVIIYRIYNLRKHRK